MWKTIQKSLEDIMKRFVISYDIITEHNFVQVDNHNIVTV